MNEKLYQKMYLVMCDTEAIEKNMVIGSGKNSYKAVSEAAMLNLVKPLLKKHKLIVFPVEGDIKDNVMTWQKTGYDGITKTDLRAITELKVFYKIVDVESGESEMLVGFGNGADPQDKGAGKASTYSFKNMLSKTFMLFSGEDTDNTHSDDINGDTPQGNGNTPNNNEVVVTTQILIDMATSKGVTEAQLCKKYNTKEVKFIKKEDKKTEYELLKNGEQLPTSIDKMKIESIKVLAERKGVKEAAVCAAFKITKFEQMGFEMWRKATEKLELKPDHKKPEEKDPLKSF